MIVSDQTSEREDEASPEINDNDDGDWADSDHRDKSYHETVIKVNFHKRLSMFSIGASKIAYWLLWNRSLRIPYSGLRWFESFQGGQLATFIYIKKSLA